MVNTSALNAGNLLLLLKMMDVGINRSPRIMEKRKIRDILVKEIKSQIKGKKQERLLDSLDMNKIKRDYKTKPGKASMEINSVGETAFQRAIFLSRKSKINFNSKKDILWKDLELPVILTESPRRNCVDLIGNIGNQLVICELKFMKETSSDSPWYAVLELLIYYYIILENCNKLDDEEVYHENIQGKFEWKGILSPKPLLIVVANEEYWNCWLKKQKNAYRSKLLKWLKDLNKELRTEVFLIKTINVDFEAQKRRASGKAYLPEIKSHIWEKI
jgi:hypothetical protein